MSKRQAIIRVQHGKDNPYFMVRRNTAQDARLSFEARGVLLYLLSKPDDWETNKTDLMREGQCGRDRINRILKELEEFGYLMRNQSRTEEHKFAENEYTIYERPQPLTENPSTGKPSTENPQHTEYRSSQSTEETSLPQSGGAALDDDEPLDDTQEPEEPEEPERKRSPKQRAMDNMVEALIDVQSLNRDVLNKHAYSGLRSAAKSLMESKATPDDIPGLYAWCKRQSWSDSMTEHAMAKWWPRYVEHRSKLSEPLNTNTSQHEAAMAAALEAAQQEAAS